MELLVFCSGTSYSIIVLSRAGHVCEAEGLSVSPGVLGDSGKAAMPLWTSRSQVFHPLDGNVVKVDDFKISVSTIWQTCDMSAAHFLC